LILEKIMGFKEHLIIQKKIIYGDKIIVDVYGLKVNKKT
jgi:hypothetical protein